MTRLTFFAFVGLLSLTLMSNVRQYGKGLDLDKLKDIEVGQMLTAPFGDASIYFVGGVVMDYVNHDGGLTFLETYRAGVLRMIPSDIYGEKPLPKTIETMAMAMGGDEAAFKAGFAVPFYVENYISFGWFGVVLGSFLVGCACAWVENLVLRHPRPLACLFFAMMSAYAFIYFHRGYFPQQLDYFMFMVGIPLFVLYKVRHRVGI